MIVARRDFGLFDGAPALLLEPAGRPRSRAPVHLQAARTGYLRLGSPAGPVLWARVWSDLYGATVMRAPRAKISAIGPLRAAEARHAPGRSGSYEFLAAWIHRYARALAESSCSPLAGGRHYLLGPIATGLHIPTGAFGKWPTHTWPPVELRGLDASVIDQRELFEYQWDGWFNPGLLLSRLASPEDDGRVKAYRKLAREKRLPPLLVWWCHGLFAHVLLDGHDRLHAAMLENVEPDILALADLLPTRAVEKLRGARAASYEHAKLALDLGDAHPQAKPMKERTANALLRSRWDPRLDWDIATPAFPMDGGVRSWKREVRGAAKEHGCEVPEEMFESARNR